MGKVEKKNKGEAEKKNKGEMKKKKSKIYCSVYGCHSYYGSPGVKAFHKFPPQDLPIVTIINKYGVEEKVGRLTAWKKKLKMGKKESKHMRICSKHFSDSSYIPHYKGDDRSKFNLKENAVPDRNLPKTPIHGSAVTSNAVSRRPRKRLFNDIEVSEKEEVVKEKEIAFDVSADEDNDKTDRSSRDHQNHQNYPSGSIFAPENFNIIELTPSIRKRDMGTQTEPMAPFLTVLTDEKKLNTATGLQSFKILDALTEVASKLQNKRAEKKKKRGKHKLPMRDRIALTLTKLKQNLTFVMLSLLFGMSRTQCKRIFKDTVVTLACCLQRQVPWPSFETTKQLLPMCFEKFPNVRVVLDCTELLIQRPKCLNCRIKVYSQYKSNNTIKFMTGVSPDGQIIFISEPYGGRASDKAIFERSGLIERLEPFRDQIMVDKGFLIDSICSSYGVKLVRPPFLKNKKKFTKIEAEVTRDIAKARVHVERANQRIKIFKIFSSKLDWTLVPVVQEAFFVVCALVNLSSPILADSRFIGYRKKNVS